LTGIAPAIAVWLLHDKTGNKFKAIRCIKTRGADNFPSEHTFNLLYPSGKQVFCIIYGIETIGKSGYFFAQEVWKPPSLLAL
jgi:hypothetical protein